MSGEFSGSNPAGLPRETFEGDATEVLQSPRAEGNELEQTEPIPIFYLPDGLREAAQETVTRPPQEPSVPRPDLSQGYRIQRVQAIPPSPQQQAPSWAKPRLEVDDSAFSTSLQTLAPASETPIFAQLQADRQNRRPIAQVTSLQERGQEPAPAIAEKGSIFDDMNRRLTQRTGQTYDETRRSYPTAAPRFEQMVTVPADQKDYDFTPPPRTLHITNRALPIRIVPVSETRTPADTTAGEGSLLVETPVAAVTTLDKPEVAPKSPAPEEHPVDTAAFLGRIKDLADMPQAEAEAPAPSPAPIEAEPVLEPEVTPEPQAVEQQATEEIIASYELSETTLTLRGLRDSVVEYAGRHKRMVQAAEIAGTVAAAAVMGAKLFGRLRRR
ncbi:MAG: hypothetical protein ACQR33_04540 [Candidatus Saccharibacteria bacterium]